MQRIDADSRGSRARGGFGEQPETGEIADALIASCAIAFAPQRIDLCADAKDAAIAQAVGQIGRRGNDGEMAGAIGRGVRHDFMAPERKIRQGNVARRAPCARLALRLR